VRINLPKADFPAAELPLAHGPPTTAI
jgi:hypothetical protein